MTLQSFITEHKTKLKTIKKLIVRDLDEIEKNTFVAYVDEGENSFDVQIVFDTKKNIKQTNCDCTEGGTCNHIIALANFIFENKTEKTALKKPTKRKLSETDQLLETLDNESIRIWLSELLNKNKELAFVFKNNFSETVLVVDEILIKKTIQDSISSIIGKRKKVETSEVKKIVDNLNTSLKPILEAIFSKFSIENHHFFKIIIDVLEEFNYSHNFNSTRIIKFVESLYENKLKALFNIKDINEWQKAVQYYMKIVFSEKFYQSDLDFIKKIYDFSKTNEIQKKFVVTTLEELFIIQNQELNENYRLAFILEEFVLVVFTENDLLKKFQTHFQPRRFQNNHNVLLIQELVKLNQNELAEKYCLAQIEGNYKYDYDLPYVKILISIYKNNNENQKLANILVDYGKYLFSIENYNFIKANAAEERFKKYRQSALTNSRNAFQSGNIEAFDFYYEIKKLDGKPNDLFELLSNAHQLSFVNKYKEIAFNLNENVFITTLLSISIYGSYHNDDLKEIVNYILSKFDKPTLQFYLKNRNYNYYNHIYKELDFILKNK